MSKEIPVNPTSRFFRNLPDQGTDIDAVLMEKEASCVLVKTIEDLPLAQAELIVRCYFQGENLSQVGSRMGISASRASQLHRQALIRLRSNLRHVIGGLATVELDLEHTWLQEKYPDTATLDREAVKRDKAKQKDVESRLKKATQVASVEAKRKAAKDALRARQEAERLEWEAGADARRLRVEAMDLRIQKRKEAWAAKRAESRRQA
jgi:hypothetical protein